MKLPYTQVLGFWFNHVTVKRANQALTSTVCGLVGLILYDLVGSVGVPGTATISAVHHIALRPAVVMWLAYARRGQRCLCARFEGRHWEQAVTWCSRHLFAGL